ncbi:MAG TPA: hypothetical protein IAC41_12680 [Candidatus Merdenecus merdavium]|nr:hypothetical protein [Candidatus Merdenecus merdavium]
MSSKTKIVVLRMKEVIYTGIFVALGILLILVLFFMFLPRNKEKKEDATVPTISYTAGVYSTPIVLNNNTMDLEVVVDKDHISSIRLVNLSEAVTTMYPLMEPTLEELAVQIYESQSLEDITYSEHNKYTSMLLLDGIEKALEKAADVS